MMANLPRPKLRTAFKKAKVIAPLHTGGPIAVTQDGTKLVTCVGEEAVLTDVKSGTEICRFVGDTESITSLCISPSARHLLIFTNAQALRIYEIPSSSTPLTKPIHPIRVIGRAHDSPVHVSKVDPTSTYLASGSADGVVKVWDYLKGYVTHVFKGHGGVVSALTFDLQRDSSAVGYGATQMRLITASVDSRIRIFDLTAAASVAKSGGTVKPEAILEGHVSVPRGLDVSQDGRYLVSGGRDSVVLVWDLSARQTKGKGSKGKEKAGSPILVKTIPVLERVEAVGLLSEEEELAGTSSSSTSDLGKLRFYTAGEKGVVKVWDAREGSVLFTLGTEAEKGSEELEEQRQILNAIYLPTTSTILTLHADQNILFHSLHTRTLTRQLIGYNDEIVDATFLSSSSSDSHLALATNSSLIRIYDVETLDARLLEGHGEIVLCLDKSTDGRVLFSGSKDRTARLWAPSADSTDRTCVGVCIGHAESVGAVALSRKGMKFGFTGSQDRTIKMWDLKSLEEGEGEEEGGVKRVKSLLTQKAHDKDINALDVSPDDRLLASGSQDRLAKIWGIDYPGGSIKLLATLRGHKRGVWSVRFSRAEAVLATGSGDRTVRIWECRGGWECLRVLEGHAGAVLRVNWLPPSPPSPDQPQGQGQGQVEQLVSCGGDGLVKVWEGREERCLVSLDGHEERVWAVAVAVGREGRGVIVSVGADSVVNFWEDETGEKEGERERERVGVVEREQEFLNYLSLRDYASAISLALSLRQPGRLLELFKDLSAEDGGYHREEEGEGESQAGKKTAERVIRKLTADELVTLLGYVRDWNTKVGTSAVAQGVLGCVVRCWSVEEVIRAFEGEGVEGGDGGKREGLREVVEGMIAYTERHLVRMERLVKESWVVDYVIGEMDGLGGEVEGMEVDED